jgi:hypothetical protein
VRGCPSLTLRPFVLGPDDVPVIATEGEAERDVPLAVLSAMTHGRGRQVPAVLESLAAAPRTIDPDTAAVFVHFWRHPLAEQVREEGREEGRAQERADAVLRNLRWRQIDVCESVRERVLSCTDLDELGTWLDRSHHVTDARGLFGEGS